MSWRENSGNENLSKVAYYPNIIQQDRRRRTEVGVNCSDFFGKWARLLNSIVLA